MIPFPLSLARLSAKFFGLFPKPLLTEDQLRLLKYDNIPSGKYKTNSDIGIPSRRYFNDEVKKYCYMWKEGGQFSTEKYNFENIKKNRLNSLSKHFCWVNSKSYNHIEIVQLFILLSIVDNLNKKKYRGIIYK